MLNERATSTDGNDDNGDDLVDLLFDDEDEKTDNEFEGISDVE